MDELETLRQRVHELEAENAELRESSRLSHKKQGPIKNDKEVSAHGSSLSLHEYKRYGRQMIVPGFGSLPSQLKLKAARVLVVGAGGLGCPALLYLCGAGVGTLGILDDDTVDISNLHRQVLHTTDTVGMLKCESARRHLSRLNPHVSLVCHPVRLSADNAFDIFAQYDLVVDCTDAPASRYLINDVAVLSGIPIVSGSGVRGDGQFTVLHHGKYGPCYRCFYPKPPRPDSVSTCGDSGVLGPAIGLMGIALATETIKVIIGAGQSPFEPFLAMYSAWPQQSMRIFKMRRRQPGCAVCGPLATITRDAIESGDIDYAAFCGAVDYNVVPQGQRRSVAALKEYLDAVQAPVLLDVRPVEQFLIASIPGSVNIEWNQLSKAASVDLMLPESFDKTSDEIFVICRHGNDSQYAAQKLSKMGFAKVHDVIGGLNQWSREIDCEFPMY